ncbi:MAG TPA: hypothetical protein VEH51_01160 [Burkholderiales bacterium]|nr:hypothetical protein [Burkholderiales bacterium]
MGPDTYVIANSEWGFTSGSYQNAEALKEASEYCKGLGKEMLRISTSQNNVRWGKTPAAEVQFRCLSPGDPDLKRPTLLADSGASRMTAFDPTQSFCRCE